MYFWPAKLLGALIDPSIILMALMAAGGLATIARRWRLGLILQGVALSMVVLLGILPGGVWFALPLESRFPANPTLPDEIVGIVALGGTERLGVSTARGEPSLSDPAPIAALVALGRRYPNAKLVFTGGSSAFGRPSLSESDVVRDFLVELGIDGDRILYENRSRNTRENAVFTRDLVHPKAGEHWIMVAQAISLPRAIGAFRAVGWDTIPFPAGYFTAGPPQALSPPDLAGGLKLASVAMHEWVGLLVYRLMGYTSEIFPG
jgi:uncharacterized SAM-binding protein YcdF (DUF218 family)